MPVRDNGLIDLIDHDFGKLIEARVEMFMNERWRFLLSPFREAILVSIFVVLCFKAVML